IGVTTRYGHAVVQASCAGTGLVDFAYGPGTGAARLVFTTAPVSGTASNSATLGPMSVQVRDQYGNPVVVGTDTTVALSSTSSGALFATVAGGTPVTSVTINAGSSTQGFYYGDTKAGSPTITASSSGLTSATQTETIAAGSAGKLAIISSAFTATASNSATSPVTVQLQDQFGNAVAATSNVTVGLASTSTGARFAATSGGSSVTSVTISTGATGTTFYYGDTKAGSPTITASSSGLTSATQTETITAGSAGKLAIISSA